MCKSLCSNLLHFAISQDKIQQIVEQWLQDKNNKDNFKEQFPFYFNVIKRGNHPKNYYAQLTKIRNGLQTQNHYFNYLQQFNQRALNNAIHPVPLLYEEPQLEKDITSIKEFFLFQIQIYSTFYRKILESSIFHQLKKTFNFGIINMIFYNYILDQKKFEISDSAPIYNNSLTMDNSIDANCR